MEGRGTHHSNNSGGGGGGRAHDDSNRSLGYMSIVEAVDGEEDYSDEDDYDEDDYDGAEGEEGGIDGEEEEEEEGGFDIRQARAMVEGLERAALSEIASMGSASPPPQHAPAGSFLSSLSAGLGPSAAAAAATQGKPAAAGEQGGGGEGYYAPGVDEIAELQGLGDGQRRRRAGARRKKRSKLSPELSRMMGEANMLYMSGDFDDAVNLLLELVRRAPNVSDPYHTLGLIHEDMQDRKKALEFYMIAAHLTPKDATLWKRLGLMSRQENNPKQAIYCYSRAIRLDGRDVDSLWDRSVIYAEMGRLKQASEGFHALLALRPADSEVAKELAKLHHQLSETDKAISVLEETFQHFTAPKSKQQEGKGKENEVQQEANEEEEDEDEAAIDLDLVNMLAELYMGTGQFQKAVELVEATSKKLDTSLEKLPLDLLINFAICQAYLGNLPLAEKYFEILETQKVSSFGDLQFDVAGTLMAVGEYRKALRFYDKLVEGDHNDSSLNEENNHVVNPYNQPTVWMRKAGCYAHLNELENAAEQYEAVLREEPDNAEACLALADIYKTMGQPQRALDVAARQIEHNKSNLSSSINQETMQEQALQPITATSTIPPPLLPPSSSTTTAPSLSSSTSSLPKEQQPADKAAPPEEPLLLDGVDIRVLLQKGLLHFSLKEYEAFLESCYDLVYKATRNGRNSAVCYRFLYRFFILGQLKNRTL
ncbi:General transcription factor 3C polypeptide 3 [Balamuthia mandrillaris]